MWLWRGWLPSLQAGREDRMTTYTVRIDCDAVHMLTDSGCDESVYVQGENHRVAFSEVQAHAQRLGWYVEKTRAYCPDHIALPYGSPWRQAA